MKLNELLAHGLALETDKYGQAEWRAHNALETGPFDAWAVRITESDRLSLFSSVTVWPVVVIAESADQALSEALWRHGPFATAEIIAGPVPVPNVDDALVDALRFH